MRLAAPALAGVYACVLARTVRIARLVAAAERAQRPPRWLSSRAQLGAWAALSAPGAAVAGWAALRWAPAPLVLHPTRVRSVLACGGEHALAHLLPLSPALLLLAACVALAIRTRRLPHNFNETRFIGSLAVFIKRKDRSEKCKNTSFCTGRRSRSVHYVCDVGGVFSRLRSDGSAIAGAVRVRVAVGRRVCRAFARPAALGRCTRNQRPRPPDLNPQLLEHNLLIVRRCACGGHSATRASTSLPLLLFAVTLAATAPPTPLEPPPPPPLRRSPKQVNIIY